MNKKVNKDTGKNEVTKPKHEDFSNKKEVLIKENVRENTETTGSTGPQKTNDKTKE